MSFKDAPEPVDVPLPLEYFGQSNTRKEAPNPAGYKVLSVRLREAEHRAFLEESAKAGLSANMALRIAARRITGYLETDEDTRATLREISGHISQISNSLMVISHSAAKSGQFDMAEISKIRMAFGEQFARLDGRMRCILNISTRRQDGRAMLTKSVAKKFDH